MDDDNDGDEDEGVCCIYMRVGRVGNGARLACSIAFRTRAVLSGPASWPCLLGLFQYRYLGRYIRWSVGGGGWRGLVQSVVVFLSVLMFSIPMLLMYMSDDEMK